MGGQSLLAHLLVVGRLALMLFLVHLVADGVAGRLGARAEVGVGVFGDVWEGGFCLVSLFCFVLFVGGLGGWGGLGYFGIERHG